MMERESRRRFLATSAAGALVGCSDFSFLGRLAPVRGEEARLPPHAVQLDAGIEPLVRLLEETPRERVLEEVGQRLRGGLSYRELLTALFLAGVRNIQPRPAVGFKFHAVLVVHSAHLASLHATDQDRWLPIFWSIDEFKSSQQRDVQEGNWTMSPVAEMSVPPAHRAADVFQEAMQKWDEDQADAAMAGLYRTAGAHEIFETLARFGVRDFRSIGHKAIYVANAWRTLQCIGWRHGEPILRSLAYALLNHNGEPNPATSDLEPDRAGRANLERLAKIPKDWRGGELQPEATRELLAAVREHSADEVSELVVQQLQKKVSPVSIYDGLMLAAGELLMRQPGIVGLHAVTSTNAMRYLFETAAEDETRQLILLQNAAFLPLFYRDMQRRGKVGSEELDTMEPADIAGNPADAAQSIFDDVSGNRPQAARKVLAYLKAQYPVEELMSAARRLIFLKGTDSHDYKFSSAVLEDYYHISPAWRDRFLASSVFNLRGSQAADNGLVERIRGALKA